MYMYLSRKNIYISFRIWDFCRLQSLKEGTQLYFPVLYCEPCCYSQIITFFSWSNHQKSGFIFIFLQYIFILLLSIFLLKEVFFLQASLLAISFMFDTKYSMNIMLFFEKVWFFFLKIFFSQICFSFCARIGHIRKIRNSAEMSYAVLPKKIFWSAA
jgi:hypothetical protein